MKDGQLANILDPQSFIYSTGVQTKHMSANMCYKIGLETNMTDEPVNNNKTLWALFKAKKLWYGRLTSGHCCTADLWLIKEVPTFGFLKPVCHWLLSACVMLEDNNK